MARLRTGEVGSISELEEDEVVEELDSLGHLTGVEIEGDAGSAASELSDAIRKPFNPELIDVITRNPTVDLLLSRLRGGQLDLQPDFQRRAGIWKPRAKSRLIESLLLFDGASFEELPGRLQTRLRETELVVHLIRRGTPDEVKFNIFARINIGGLPLSQQELRHALIPGEGRAILRDWAESETFRSATGYSVRSERMADREMILRFLAFRLTNPHAYAEDDFDRFLRDSMRRLNSLSPGEVDRLWRQFEKAMRAAEDIFGEYAFRKRDRRGRGRRLPINKALFEAVAVNLTAAPKGKIDTLVRRHLRVEKSFQILMRDVDFQAAISQGTGDRTKVRYRFDAVREVLAEVAKA